MPALTLPGNAPYFEPVREQLSQGDIFLAPTVMLYGVARDDAPSVSPVMPPTVGEIVTVRLWGHSSTDAPHGAPAVNAVAGWTPVMVLSHDCELDKEFNEQVDHYLRDHPDASEDEACALIAARPDVDRHVQVAPLLPYDETVVPAARHEGIRQAHKIGYVPVPAMADYGNTEFFIALNRVSTVGRELLPTHYKVISLSEVARQLLRFKLAEALASRNVVLVSALEAALGRTIREVRPMKSRNTTATIGLLLDDGSEVQVEAKIDKPGPARSERVRPATGSGSRV
jgi:hypothetical protein